MAVYIAASDERYSKGNHRAEFFYGGFLAPLTAWVPSFTDQWQQSVLDGPPRIPWLHMADIRHKPWRDERGITRTQCERRVRAAFELISETSTLTPIGADLNSGHLLDTFTKKTHFKSGAKRRFEPDYLAFLAYAYSVLMFCDIARPDAEKVDFVVERNQDITNHIQEFYKDLPKALMSIGLERLIPLVGELIPGGKDRIPLQAADVLCSYSQRYREGSLNDKDIRRYKVIALRKGTRLDLTDSDVTKLWEALIGDGEDEHK